jgi:hypothetical protein
MPAVSVRMSRCIYLSAHLGRLFAQMNIEKKGGMNGRAMYDAEMSEEFECRRKQMVGEHSMRYRLRKVARVGKQMRLPLRERREDL